MGNGIMRKLFYLMFLVVLVGNVQAATSQFLDTTGDHFWKTAGNWSAGIPTGIWNAGAGGNLTCNIDSGTTATPANMYWGHNGYPAGNVTLNVNTGGALNPTGIVFISYAAGGYDGTIDVNGGDVNCPSDFYVGYAGVGTLDVNNGGTVTAPTCYVGTQFGSNGTLTINGGTVTASDCYVGTNPSSIGQVTINDGNITITTGRLYVGNSGQGSLDMSGGSITGGGFYIGRTSTAQGSLNMSGGSITTGEMLTGVADGSNGSMVMSAGTVNASSNVAFGWAGTGSLTMTGGTMAVGNLGVASPDLSGHATGVGDVNLVGGTITATYDLYIGPAGRMDIKAGTLILGGDDRTTINGYINDGLLTGYGESKNVHVYYDGSDTIVTAGADLANYAWAPSPYDGEIVPAWNFNDVNLIWAPGDSAAKHRIYFGQTFDEVNDANTSTAGIYKGEQNLDANEFDPGTLELDRSYFWRIDEVNDVDEWKGGIWMFTVQAAYAGSTKPLPRIKARTHSPYPEFYNTVTNAKFVPEGNAYVRLYEASDNNRYHATFIDGFYDANDAEAALEDMADSGYNIVYVFIQGGGTVLNAEGKYGTGGDDINYNEPNLYEPSMDNFMDFLERANENEIYVMPVLIMWPFNHYYRSRASRPEDDPNLEHLNRWYLADGAQEAKEIYCEYFVKYIKDTNPALLF
jgi:T5SS/PEP-CTERM-associated repeat protein